MERRMMLWVLVGVMFIATMFLTFKAGAVGSVETVQTAAATVKSASSYGGMVGGC